VTGSPADRGSQHHRTHRRRQPDGWQTRRPPL